MNYNQAALIHETDNFKRETLVARMEALGLNKIDRMELFLWDLEIFLQIQEVLKKRVVLKGGAATQLYLPVEYQRSSVDIDMLCFADEAAIGDALRIIEGKFGGEGGLFKFRRHFPKESKTKLPLLTFYMDVPSVCLDKEIFGDYAGTQEIKVEFFTMKKAQEHQIIKAPSVFAMETDKSYQVMPLDFLFADKLTTLGPATIGVPEDRKDEQIKHLYDLDSLLKFKISEFNFNKIKEYFIYRSKLEAADRGISYDGNEIMNDMLAQLGNLSRIDMQPENELVKIIYDFQSLYLRKSISKSKSEWSIAGKKLSLTLNLMDSSSVARDIIGRVFDAERALKFEEISGEQKGELIIRFKKRFIEKFKNFSNYPPEILKGKNSARILWEFISIDNLDEICSWVETFIKENIS